MVYQNFFALLILLAIAVIVTAAKVILKKEKPRPPLSLSSDLVFGYVGAWLGTPVFGRWVEGISYQNVSIIPALLGAMPYWS